MFQGVEADALSERTLLLTSPALGLCLVHGAAAGLAAGGARAARVSLSAALAALLPPAMCCFVLSRWAGFAVLVVVVVLGVMVIGVISAKGIPRENALRDSSTTQYPAG